MFQRLFPRPAVLLLACAFLAPAASASVFRTRTGESVKGRPIQERTDDRVLVFEDLLTGSVRTIAWEAIEPADRERVLRELDRLPTATYTTPGVRLTLRVGTEEQELYGVIDREDATTVYLVRGGETVPVPKERIAERSDETLDVREVWNPAQLMERYDKDLRAKEIDPLGPEGKPSMDRGEYAEYAGALKDALDSYQRAAADQDFPDRATAEQRAQRVEALLRDQAALTTLRDLKTKLASDLFKAVAKGLQDFESKHPSPSEGVHKALEKFKADVKTRREKYMRQQARYQFPRICVKLIETKVREKDVKLQDAKQWAKRELAPAAFKALADKLTAKDEVTEDEARKFWETRWEGVPKGSWLNASYGSGSFVAYQPKVQPPKPRPAPAGGNRGGNNQGPAPTLQLPKPPTNDQWWDTHGPERIGWLMAHFVESSALFEVADDMLRSPCKLCLGEGIRSFTTQTGEFVPYLCNRCAGGRYDLTVRYR